MPYKNPETQSLVAFLLENMLVIGAFFLSFIISILRTLKEGKADWIEAGICGFLTVASYSLLNQFKLDSQLVVFVGGFIGWFGTNYTKKYIELAVIAIAKRFGLIDKSSCELLTQNEENKHGN